MMLYGEQGRFPISIFIKKRILGFGYSSVHTGGKLSSTMYKIIYSNYINGHKTYNWLDNVKSSLDDCGCSYIWIDEFYLGSKNMLLNLIDTSLKPQFKQTWQSKFNDTSKCINYRMYKTEHCLENYIDVSSPHFVQTYTNFRLCNNYLPVEKGSWLGISRNERMCNLCNTNSIGDEFHYSFQCNFFNNERKQFLPTINSSRNSNAFTLHFIMCETNETKLFKICRFLKIVLDKVRSPPG